MYKCLKVTFIADLPHGFLQKSIQKHAKNLRIEGVAQLLMDDFVKIVICGSLENVDAFLDQFYKEVNKLELNELQIEPFLKDKDYRGVFRVIE